MLLIPIGDVHLGARACDVDALRRTVSEIQNTENAFWVGMGDYAECINLTDKRFDLKSLEPRFLPRLDDLANACFEELKQILTPIREKCLGLLVGNHEETLRLRQSQDIHGALCLALRAPNLGYDCLLRWTFRRCKAAKHGRFPATTLKILASHGTIASRRPGAKINRMEDIASNFNCDIAMFGHGHSKLASERIELDVPASGTMRLMERKKIVIMTGCYRKNHAEGTLDYAEKAGYPPVPIGSPRIRIRPFALPRDRFVVSVG